MQKLLIIDDESNLLYSMQKALRRDSLNVITADTAAQGLAMVKAERPDAVILDVRLPDGHGLDVFDEIRTIDASIPVIIVTAYSKMETAVEAMKRGAYEYLLKPIELDSLREHVERVLEISRPGDGGEIPGVLGEPRPEPRIIGRSLAMQEVFKAIGRVASQHITVLIQGESGSGKELLAEAICEHSPRAKGPFLTINCAARSRKRCWKANYSATNGARSPGQTVCGSESSNRWTAAPCFSTKSATCPPPRKPRSCACCRTEAFIEWEATKNAA